MIKIFFRFLLIIGAIFAIFLFFSFGLIFSNKNKIVKGVKFAGLNLGGLEKQEAKNKIEEKINKFLSEKIAIEYKTPDGKKNEIIGGNFKEIGVNFDIETALANAYAIGRSSSLFKNFKTHLSVYFKGAKIEPTFNLSRSKFEKYIEKYLKPPGNPAQNAAIVFVVPSGDHLPDEKKQFVILPEKEGLIIPKKEVENQIHEMSRELKPKKLTIALIKDIPEVTQNETEFALELTKDYFGAGPYFLKYSLSDARAEENSIPIKNERLAELFDFPIISQPGKESNKILGFDISLKKTKELLTLLAQGINKEPVSAQFVNEDHKVIAFQPSYEGVRLNIDASAALFKQNLLSKKKETELVISKIQPEITTASINNFGIAELLGRGVTDFSGSPASRVHNIKVSSAKFNGVLIKPNERFSFNKILGEVNREEGYQPALVIKDNQTIPEYGGGICQVSTTTFRAAIFSGLDIIERFPHSYAVKYYNPQGFDATVYPGGPDLKFINDTPNHILIQTKVEGNKLIIEFYGTKDGRIVKIKGPMEFDKKKDGSMKAELFYEAWQGDELINNNHFFSDYFSPKDFPLAKNPLE